MGRRGGGDTAESEWEETLQPMNDTIVLKTNWEKEAEARKYHHQHGSKATFAEVLLQARTAAADRSGTVHGRERPFCFQLARLFLPLDVGYFHLYVHSCKVKLKRSF